MSRAFGGPLASEPGTGPDGVSRLSPQGDMAAVRELLSGLRPGLCGRLRIYRPRPTAAFAPRDVFLPGHEAARAALAARGFTAVERRTGGQLAVYDEATLIIDLVAPHDEPRRHVIERFRGFSAAIAAALAGFDIDARIGAVPGEYCPGDYSVNAGGRVKLAGIAQRVSRQSYHLGAVVSVSPAPVLRDAVAEAYGLMGLDFDPAGFGAAADLASGLDAAGLAGALEAGLLGLVAGA